jgi:ribonuclease Z
MARRASTARPAADVASRELVVLGTASQAPTRARNHNGYFLRWDAAGLLFDPGEGTQRQMLFAGVTASQVTGICVTHFHGDHCLGLPGVLQRMALDQVTHPVTVSYPAESGEYFGRLRRAALFHDRLDLVERPLSASAGPGPAAAPVAVGLVADGLVAESTAFRLEARPLSHRVPTVGYRLTEPDGRRMLPAALAARGISGPDIGLLQKAKVMTLPNGTRVTVDDISEPRRGQKFAFVMDTRICDAAIELANDADLLVCEATFADADAELAGPYGHLTAGQAGRIAAEAGARTLVLTHFSQRYGPEDTARFADEAAAAFTGEVIVAADLDRVPVPARR